MSVSRSLPFKQDIMKSSLKGKQTDSTVQHFPFWCCQVWVIRSIKYTEKMFSFASWNMIQQIGIYKFFLTNTTDSLKSPGLRVFNTIPCSGFPPDSPLSSDTTASAAICVDSDKQPWWIGFPCEQLPQFASIMQWQKDTFTNLLPCRVVSVLNATS